MTQFLNEVHQRLLAISEFKTVDIHKDWVQVILSQLRQHLDASGAKSKYPTLTFFCNWNQHKDLNNPYVQDVLENISKVIVDENSGHPADRISEILLSRLQKEIIAILKKDANIESGVFSTHSNWVAFSELMFPFILNKPLKRTRQPDTHHWVESLELYDNKGKVYWKIRVFPEDTEFVGPLVRVP